MTDRNHTLTLSGISFCVISILTLLFLILGMCAFRPTDPADDEDTTAEVTSEIPADESDEPTPDSVTVVYNEQNGEIARTPLPQIKSPLFRFQTDYSGGLYLRSRSYGDYNGTGFDEMEPYAAPSADSSLNVIGRALCAADRPTYVFTASYFDKPRTVLTPYYYTESTFASTDVSFPEKETHFEVTFTPAKSDTVYQYVTETPEELAYRQYVYETYLTLPEDTEAALHAYLSRVGLDRGASVADVAAHVMEAIQYTPGFAEIPADTDSVLYVLEQSQEGICQHYAAAATLIYRALGIPARYVTGYYCQATAPGAWQEVPGSNAHAWVEIYEDGIGWMPVEVTGFSNPSDTFDEGVVFGTFDADGLFIGYEPLADYDGPIGSGSVNLPPIQRIQELHLEMLSAEKTYDSVVYANPRYQIIDGYLLEGHTLHATMPDKLTDVGSIPNRMTEYTITDRLGSDVTSMYDVTITEGTLTVKTRQITVAFQEDTGYTVCSGYLAHGDSIVADSAENDLRIINRSGADKTANYEISYYVPAEIIDPRPLVIRSKDAEKYDDGTPLVSDAYEIVSGSLLPGDRVELTPIDTYSAVGIYDNIFTVAIFRLENGTETEVTHYYSIDCQYGTLTIHPR